MGCCGTTNFALHDGISWDRYHVCRYDDDYDNHGWICRGPSNYGLDGVYDTVDKAKEKLRYFLIEREKKAIERTEKVLALRKSNLKRLEEKGVDDFEVAK